MTANDIQDITAIATLGLGEAGTAITTGLAQAWRKDNPSRRILAVDTALGDNVRGAAINERALAIDLEIEGSYTKKLSDAGAVFCVVTGVEAKNAALAARDVLKPGTLFFDVNTLTGPQTADIAQEMAKAGIDYVDFAAMGGFASSGHQVPFLISGPAAQRAAAFLQPFGFNVQVMSARAGDASSVKIIRSVMAKGMEALSVECMVAAHRAGLVNEVLECFSDIDARTFAGMVKSLTTTHIVHAKRRMEEMDKAQENLIELGIRPLMSERTRESHARTVDAGVAPADARLTTFEEALEILSEKVVGRL
ncbi:MAG: 3-hydroxyisobutyrate dehydrogenase [Gammaproteobacteria bacterium]|jgi:3-hydroxyisobutyrate dehydrogenase